MNNKEEMREYQEKSVWELAHDYWSPIKRKAPWVEFEEADYKENPLLMKDVYGNWYDEQNRTLQKKMRRASLIVVLILEILWLASGIGSVAFVTCVEAWCARLYIHNDVSFYISAFMLVFADTLVVYFLIKIHKKWTRKHLY